MARNTNLLRQTGRRTLEGSEGGANFLSQTGYETQMIGACNMMKHGPLEDQLEQDRVSSSVLQCQISTTGHHAGQGVLPHFYLKVLLPAMQIPDLFSLPSCDNTFPQHSSLQKKRTQGLVSQDFTHLR